MEKVSETIVVNVGQLLREEYRQLSCVRDQVTELRNDLGIMSALFRMQSEADEGAADHFDREWMKQVRELGYDAEDCVDLYSLRVKSRLDGGVCSRLTHLLMTLYERRGLAGEILALRARATAISERYTRYGVNREAMRRSPSLLGPAPQVQARSASAHTLLQARDAGDPHRLVGMGDQANTLVEKLKEEQDDEEHSLKVFSVVGFGGVGKTTLAMEVCRQLEAKFPCQAMVPVSQAFEPSRDLRSLLKRLLQQVVKPKTENQMGVKEEETLGDINNFDEHKLCEKLNEILEGKRYLIVIDDVWTIRAWEAILSVLPKNKASSRVIVTTRLKTVAKACSPSSVSGHYIHDMKPLELEESRKLFINRVFSPKDDPVEFETVMNKILKKCGGLPLAIVSIASVLAAWTSPGSIDKWNTMCNSIGSQMESNPTLEGMKHIVTLSYNHLPHELKSCMMYLSIFPEDYEINKERLLHRWIAEGLVLEKRGLTQMEVAESYFDELWSRNMVQPATFLSDGRVESCRVHDMLLEVIVSKSLESNFVSLLGGQYQGMSYDRIRRLSMHGAVGSSKIKGVHGFGGMADVRHVRSLSMFQLQEHKLLDHLDKLTLLRVLDLEDCKGLTNRHVKYICRLYLLRFLSLKDTDISKVPRQIRKLEHLQVLNVQGTKLCTRIVEGTEIRNQGLSDKVTNLEKLEHLLFSNTNYYAYLKWTLPRGIGKMKALRTLGIVVLGNDVQIAKDLGELELLEDFAITIDQQEIGDNEKVVKEFAKSLGKMQSLRRLSIEHCFSDILGFLHDLKAPPQLLRYIRIAGGVRGKLPDWVGSLTHLVEICLTWSFLGGDEVFGAIHKLPCLKSISVGERAYTDDMLVARSVHNFPSLVSLDVCANFEDDPRKFKFEEGSMQKLERLAIMFNTAYGSDMVRGFIGIEHLTSLKEVRLFGNKGSNALTSAVEHIKGVSTSHPNQQFQVVVKYH